jgi:hypothetical protein
MIDTKKLVQISWGYPLKVSDHVEKALLGSWSRKEQYQFPCWSRNRMKMYEFLLWNPIERDRSRGRIICHSQNWSHINMMQLPQNWSKLWYVIEELLLIHSSVEEIHDDVGPQHIYCMYCTVWREFLLEPTIAPISIDVAPAPGRKNDAALYLAVTFLSAYYTQYTTGLWMRIDSIRIRTQIWIRIQQFRSIWIQIRIRIHKVSKSGSTKSLNTDPIRIRIHNPGVQCTVYSEIRKFIPMDAALLQLWL